ncbi:hypothetical protein [Enterobacter phage ST22]|nr:hypothetical protein [Enterobacter phage ST22]
MTTTSRHPKYDHNGKAIRSFTVVEIQTNGHEVKKGEFPVDAEASAYNLADSLDHAFGYTGVEYVVRVNRYA